MKLFKTAIIPIHPYLNNKYTQWYYNIIENARNREKFIEYTEIHHIIPDCFYINNRSKRKRSGWLNGNSNLKENKIRLTAKEHFICHWLLTKMITGKPYYQMLKDFSSLCQKNNFQQRTYTSGKYKKIKEAYAISSRFFNTGKIPWNKGKKQSEEHNQKIAKALKGRTLTDDHCKNMSKSKVGIPNEKLKGRPRSEDVKEKLRIANLGKVGTDNGFYGKTHSKETKLHLAATHIGRKWWHNDKNLTKLSKECPGSEWIEGRKMLKT